MTFLFGTNVECIYSMPAIGATQAATTATCVSGTTGSASPFQMPALQNIWSTGNMVGKGMMIIANGGYDFAALNSGTMRLQFDNALATSAATSVLAMVSGAAVYPASATGSWQLQLWMSCVGQTGGTGSTWYINGTIECGPSNSASSSPCYMVGNTITAGIPQAVTLSNITSYFPEVWTSWATAPTAFVCSQLQVFGLN